MNFCFYSYSYFHSHSSFYSISIPFLFYVYSVSSSILFYSIISSHINSYPIISYHIITFHTSIIDSTYCWWNTSLGWCENPVNNGIFPTNLHWWAGFLNHQQYQSPIRCRRALGLPFQHSSCFQALGSGSDERWSNGKIHGNFQRNGILSCQKYGGTYWTGFF